MMNVLKLHRLWVPLLIYVIPLIVSVLSADSTEATFYLALGQHKTMVVLFYAPWCSHSKAVLPVWDDLDKAVTSNSLLGDIYIVKVDCVAEPSLYWRENISSFPVIRSYINYNALSIDYDGDRHFGAMLEHFRDMHLPYVERINEIDDFMQLQVKRLTRNRPFAIASFDSDDSLNYNYLKIDAACKREKRIGCFVTSNSSLSERLNLGVASLTMVTMFEDAAAVDADAARIDVHDASALTLARWLNVMSYPAIVELTVENEDFIFSSNRLGYESHFIFLVPDSSSSDGRTILNIMKTVWKSNAGNCIFIYIDLANLTEYSMNLLSSLQVDHSSVGAGREPTTPLLYSVLSKKTAVNFYTGLKLSDLLTVEAVSSWIQSVLLNKIAPNRVITPDA